MTATTQSAFKLDKAKLMPINRYEYLYRQASFNFLLCSEPQKPHYLELMLETAKNTMKSLGPKSLEPEDDTVSQQLKEDELKLLN